MNNAIRIVFGIIALFVMLNIPVEKIITPPSINPVYNYSLASKESQVTSIKNKTYDFIFHRPVSGNYYSTFQYEITKLNKNGAAMLNFTIPNAKDLSKIKGIASIIEKDGFLTYPDDGSFFLWYPRLGDQVLFYDKMGEFLWSRQDTHYIKAFPSGDFVLSMTGDHSRAFYMLPDLSVIGSSEGTLLINHQFSTGIEKEDSMKLCFGYLDGDIVFYNPQKRKEIRLGSGLLTKSLACNFENGTFAVHNQSPEKAQDEIRLGEINNATTTPEIKWKFRADLPERYLSTLPIGVMNDYVVVLIPENNSIHLLTFDTKGKLRGNIKISESDFSNIEEWRIYSIAGGLIVWNTHELYFINPDVVFSKKIELENVVVEENELFIQTKTRIIAYQINL